MDTPWIRKLWTGHQRKEETSDENDDLSYIDLAWRAADGNSLES
jgi:hypothetical protein